MALYMYQYTVIEILNVMQPIYIVNDKRFKFKDINW